MFERILVAIESENDCTPTLAMTARVASRDAAEVRIVHVRRLGVQVRGGIFDLETRSEAEQLVSTAVAEAVRRGLTATGEVLTIDQDDSIGAGLAHAAATSEAGAIVMSSRRRSDVSAALRGSVSHDVIRHAGCPVVIAPRDVRVVRPLRRLLLAVDGSAAAAAAERAATELAREFRSEITVLHVERPLVMTGLPGEWVAPPPQVDEVTAAAVKRLRRAGVAARPATDPWVGPIAATIVRTAAELGADLIIVGSRGLADLEAVLRGSVSHEVLHQTEMPVVVARA